jgi:hypothetical protein
MRWEEFAKVLRLLGSSQIGENLQGPNQQAYAYAHCVPTAVIIAGEWIFGNKASVQIKYTASGGSKRSDGSFQSFEKSFSMGIISVTLHDFLPGRPVDPSR